MSWICQFILRLFKIVILITHSPPVITGNRPYFGEDNGRFASGIPNTGQLQAFVHSARHQGFDTNFLIIYHRHSASVQSDL